MKRWRFRSLPLTLVLSLFCVECSPITPRNPSHNLTFPEKGIARFVSDWQSPSYEVRENASKSLIDIGEPALEAISKAIESNDPEVSWRSRNARKRICEDMDLWHAIKESADCWYICDVGYLHITTREGVYEGANIFVLEDTLVIENMKFHIVTHCKKNQFLSPLRMIVDYHIYRLDSGWEKYSTHEIVFEEGKYRKLLNGGIVEEADASEDLVSRLAMTRIIRSLKPAIGTMFECTLFGDVYMGAMCVPNSQYKYLGFDKIEIQGKMEKIHKYEYVINEPSFCISGRSSQYWVTEDKRLVRFDSYSSYTISDEKTVKETFSKYRW